VLPLRCNNRTGTQNEARRWNAAPISKTQTKSGSDATSEPLLVSIALFDLLVASLLTLLLIGGWRCVPV